MSSLLWKLDSCGHKGKHPLIEWPKTGAANFTPFLSTPAHHPRDVLISYFTVSVDLVYQSGLIKVHVVILSHFWVLIKGMDQGVSIISLRAVYHGYGSGPGLYILSRSHINIMNEYEWYEWSIMQFHEVSNSKTGTSTIKQPSSTIKQPSTFINFHHQHPLPSSIVQAAWSLAKSLPSCTRGSPGKGVSTGCYGVSWCI